MAVRNANVNVRIDQDIKGSAATILKALGVSESTFVEMAYRQLVLQRGIPFPVKLPRELPTRDTMSEAAFDAMMTEGIRQADAGKTMSLDETDE